MRKIKIKNWKANVPEMDKENKPTGKTKTIDESLLALLNVLISNIKPEDMPRGLDKFRTYNRLDKAFRKAEKTNTLELEEADYQFLKNSVDKNIPSIWGSNANYSEAIESFMEAKEDGKKD